MLITCSKSTLKSKLQVKTSSRALPTTDAYVIDYCAVLWVVKWPSKGTVVDYIRAFVKYIDVYVCKSDTYLVFDNEMSTKEIMRRTHVGKEASRKHRLSLSRPLPSQKVILTITSNK